MHHNIRADLAPLEKTELGGAVVTEDWAKGNKLSIGKLDGILGFHLRLASSALYQDFMIAVADLAVTPKQFSVLELVAANPGVSQIDIAGRLGMDRATMMALTNRLESRDFVRRAPSRVDRRRQELHLTEAGQSVLMLVHQRVEDSERRMLSDFDVDERQLITALLKRIYRGTFAVD